ncbi:MULTISPECIES: peptidoglycan DD-metalloendopeptidase family protein [unclassified Idiomarina]|uniref:peptidoglycan DD-metalloendopeptidase family protein n=1 Tax=unclassified Idiomarina TaxID=2614829 RepID=UPI000C91A537|nr:MULTISPECIES: peptidoglycan DD-metalloendopeptidase family protein [unclassified Idiomarina]MAD54379.1 peptidase M23 [Idiomarinaceae bacterium]NQZ03927.1 peptidoglycan DD-metalloendopeptidase family protein [Idiomarina sp.]|tara:strand:+ start:1902 stop:2795 length:894 start_codon:yes stop_codon:yes gene_type:complete
MAPHRVLALSIVGATLLVAGCSSRSTPAPVETLYTGKTYQDYEADSLAQANQYQVQSGETLYSIAFRASMDVNRLARINGLAEPYTIFPGQTLRLKAATQKTTSSKKPSSEKQKDISQTVAKPNTKEYVQNTYSKKTIEKQKSKTNVKERVTAKPNKKTAQVVATRPSSMSVSNKDIQWRWPVSNDVIRDFSLAERGNKGLDFAGQKGDVVNAAAAGKVVYVGNGLRGYGNLIILKHNDDFITAYAHNEKILVNEQQWVDVGQPIAEMGDSGTTRVMLHFEVRYRGKSVNPRHYLPK